jgi:hypothetical protein
MLIIRGGKSTGNFAKASDSEPPVSTSTVTRCRMPASFLFSVWLLRIDSALSSDRPELIMVAIWRLMMASDLRSTPFSKPGMVISRCSPVPAVASATVTGCRPSPRIFESAAASLGASTLPLTILPASFRLVYAKFLTAIDMISASLLLPEW